jgi:hypothetical protein
MRLSAHTGRSPEPSSITGLSLSWVRENDSIALAHRQGPTRFLAFALTLSQPPREPMTPPWPGPLATGWLAWTLPLLTLGSCVLAGVAVAAAVGLFYTTRRRLRARPGRQPDDGGGEMQAMPTAEP